MMRLRQTISAADKRLMIGRRALLVLGLLSLCWAGYLGYLISRRSYDYSLAAAAIVVERGDMSPELAGEYVAALDYLQDSRGARQRLKHEMYAPAEIEGLAAQIKSRAFHENLRLATKGGSLWLGGTLLVYALMVVIRGLASLRRSG